MGEQGEQGEGAKPGEAAGDESTSSLLVDSASQHGIPEQKFSEESRLFLRLSFA